MYWPRPFVCLCIPRRMNPDVTWGNGRGCPVVVHYWVDLQSVHGFCSNDDIAPNPKCQLVLALFLFFFAIDLLLNIF